MLNKIKTTMILATGLFIFANEADAQTWVNGYLNSNGTYVKAHYCSFLEESPFNNNICPCNYYHNKGNMKYLDLFYDFGSSSCYPIDW